MKSFRINVRTCVTLLAVTLMSVASAGGADLYMSPTGSGNKSGNSWANAMTYENAKSLEDVFGKLKAGDTINLAAGMLDSKHCN